MSDELRGVLARRNIRAGELAERVGVTPMWLSRRLRGLTPLTVDDLARICDALDVPLAEVLAGSSSPDVATSP